MSSLNATTVSDKDGGQYHIGCKPGDLNEYILLVGDPARAAKVGKLFDKIRFETQHREYVTVSGTYKGIELSVLATGIGQDNTEIALIEACQITKNPTFIRCGSCSSLQKEPNLGDLVVSTGAVRMDNTSSYFVTDGYPAVAHSDVLLALGTACQKNQTPFHVGLTASAPGFYGAQGREIPGFPIRFPNLQDDLSRMNVMNLEMETATLFVLASLRGIRAGAVCAVYGNRPKNAFADEKKRNTAEKSCIEASLGAFEILQKMDAQKKDLPLWLPSQL